jgi:hypothetical protein
MIYKREKRKRVSNRKKEREGKRERKIYFVPSHIRAV